MLRHWLNGEQGCENLPRTWFSLLEAVEIGCGSEVCPRILKNSCSVLSQLYTIACQAVNVILMQLKNV